MKQAFCAGAVALAFVLGGCSTFNKAVNGAVAWIDAPATQKAVGSLKSGVVALTCAVADASAVAREIEQGVGAGQSMVGTDGKVYVASATLCASLGGTPGPTAVIP